MTIIAKSRILLLSYVFIIACSLAPYALADPRQNAALIYYQTFLLYQPDSNMENTLADYFKGKIELKSEIELFVRNHKRVIEYATKASNIRECDWGLDYSSGSESQPPGLIESRSLAQLLLVDAKILGTQGKYNTALQRCLTVKRMARHISDRPSITYLVAMVLDTQADHFVMDLLPAVSNDLETLSWLKDKLNQIEKIPLTLKDCVEYREQSAAINMQKEKKDEILQRVLSEEGPEPASIGVVGLDRIRAADEAFFERNREYWKKYMSQVKATLLLPYHQAMKQLKSLSDKPAKDTVKNADATLTPIFRPALEAFYSREVKNKTFSNAILVALEVYSIRAKTGELPKALPKDLPKDLFSGKDFKYEKSSQEFILRCREKDVLEEKVHSYPFKTGY